VRLAGRGERQAKCGEGGVWECKGQRGLLLSRHQILKINIKLQTFFQKIVATKGSGFDSAMVHWLAYQPTPARHELLLYFVPERRFL
jgi:hypothetical protein